MNKITKTVIVPIATLAIAGTANWMLYTTRQLSSNTSAIETQKLRTDLLMEIKKELGYMMSGQDNMRSSINQLKEEVAFLNEEVIEMKNRWEFTNSFQYSTTEQDLCPTNTKQIMTDTRSPIMQNLVKRRDEPAETRPEDS